MLQLFGFSVGENVKLKKINLYVNCEGMFPTWNVASFSTFTPSTNGATPGSANIVAVLMECPVPCALMVRLTLEGEWEDAICLLSFAFFCNCGK